MRKFLDKKLSFSGLESIEIHKSDEKNKYEKKYFSSITMDFDNLNILTYNEDQKNTDKIPFKWDNVFCHYGFLYLNEELFTKYKIPKHPKSTSDMKNISKTFFVSGSDKYVMLVQFLKEGGYTSEHYHTEEEIIVCINCGLSIISLSPVEQAEGARNIEMEPVGIYVIPPKTVHQIHNEKSGSITVPIKKNDRKERSIL